jgi:hypothetical protein
MEDLPDPKGSTAPSSPARRDFFGRALRWGRNLTILGIGAGAVLYEEAKVGLVQQALFSGLRFTRRKTKTTPAAISPLEKKYAYDRIPKWRDQFSKAGHKLTEPREWEQVGIPGVGTLPPLYSRPEQAGLTLRDARGREFYQFRDPYKIYEKFEDIPQILLRSLAFVEDRTALEENVLPTDNLAIDFKRAGAAFKENFQKLFGFRATASGGSTVPIQNAKQEAYPGAKTKGFGQKVGQAFMASLRVTDTATGTNIENLQREYTKYMNIVSLGSHPRTGEVRGFNDAMAVWFGNTNFNEVLKGDLSKPEAAIAYRQALTFVMAVQQPDALIRFRKGWNAGQARVDHFLDELVEGRIIPREFAQRTRAVKLPFESVGRKPVLPPSQLGEKSVRTSKKDLLQLLGIPDQLRKEEPDPKKKEAAAEKAEYVLDHAHLTATSTLFADIDAEVSAFFRRLNKPEVAKKFELIGGKLLNESNAARVRYGLMVQEVGDDGLARVRIKTDTYNGALDLNASGKMNLGSTQKLVMGWTYNVMIGKLYDDLAGKTPEQLSAMALLPHDNLTNWALQWLQETPEAERTKLNMLKAGAERSYSSAPQGFFTGEVMWLPQNFEPREENGLRIPMQEAIWRSTNLSSARFTQDVQDCVKWHVLGLDRRIMDPDEQDPVVKQQRREKLEEFARYEGGVYQSRAFVAMQGRSEEAILQLLAERANRMRGTPSALMATYLSVYPEASLEQTVDFAITNCTRACSRSDETLAQFYGNIKAMDLNDRGYTAGVHPLWLKQAQLRVANPEISLKDSLEATKQDRVDVYKWLIEAKNPRAQQRAITIMTDQAAWGWIEGLWQNSFGYNYKLKATLANVLGGAATNTQLLTNFTNMLLADGKRPKVTNFTEFEFATGTPHEMKAAVQPVKLEQVSDPLVAAFTVEMARGNIEFEQKNEAGYVVARGTGGRLKGKIKLRDGTVLPSGGKTGTNGETETLDTRIAAYMVNLGPKLSLAAMVYLEGGNASDRFTSGVVVRVVEAMLKDNGPLQKLIDRVYGTKITPELMDAFNPVARVLRAQKPTTFTLPSIVPQPQLTEPDSLFTFPLDPAASQPTFPEMIDETPDWWKPEGGTRAPEAPASSSDGAASGAAVRTFGPRTAAVPLKLERTSLPLTPVRP